MVTRSRTGLFQKARHKYLADIVSLESPAAARESVRKLQRQFRFAITSVKKLRVARATQLAANRAKAMLRKPNLSHREQSEFREIARIYKDAARDMFRKYIVGR